ncbi:MAG: hypothetical protein HY303_16710 [Candidatus Wallbacteria bacterium]|nr:hypothetical protein [Candidatus Wallbacteria bacterium]
MRFLSVALAVFLWNGIARAEETGARTQTGTVTTYLWVKPEIRLANSKSLRLVGEPLRPAIYGSEPTTLPAQVTGVLTGAEEGQSLEVQSNGYAALPSPSLRDDAVTRLRGSVTAYQVVAPELRTAEGTPLALTGKPLLPPDNLPPERDFLVEVSGTLEGDDPEVVLRVETYRVLESLARVQGTLQSSSGSGLSLRTPQGGLLQLTGTNLQHLQDNPPAREDGLEVTGILGLKEGRPSLELVSCRLVPGLAASLAVREPQPPSIAERRLVLMEGVVFPGMDGHPRLQSTGGRCLRLSGPRETALLDNPLSRQYLVEVTGFLGGPASSDELEISSFRHLSVPVCVAPIPRVVTSRSFSNQRYSPSIMVHAKRKDLTQRHEATEAERNLRVSVPPC